MTKRYDEYKDSGIEWIGEIPSHWKVKMLKNHLKTISKGATPASVSPFKEKDTDVLFLKSTNIQNNKLDFKESFYISKEEHCKMNKSKLKKNDLMFSIAGYIGKICIIDIEKEVNTNQALAFLRTKNIEEKFLYYYFSSEKVISQVKNNSVESIIQNLSMNVLSNTKILFPDVLEQQAIATYLDNKTSKIDSALAELTKQKDLLIELKKSIIHQAVTKGLDSTVEMKDSGVEWIGEVPEEFKTLKLKSIIKFFNGYSFVDNDFSDFETGDYLIRIGNLKSNGEVAPYKSPRYLKNPPSRFKIENNSVLMALSGATAGKAVYFDKCKESLYLNQRVAKIKYPSGNLKYLYYYLSLDEVTIELMNIAKITTHPNFSKEHIMNLAISIPEKNKQDEITNYLDKKTGQIDQSIEVIGSQIAKMKEYKKTLINDVVTGKIKVID